MNVEALSRLADLAPLAESWRTYARRRLETREVEDWDEAPDRWRSPGAGSKLSARILRTSNSRSAR